MKRISVYCGSQKGNNLVYEKAAKELGAELAKNNIELVYGGGAVGLMGVLAEAVLENHGKVIGVIPDKLYEMEVAHTGLTELYRVKSMHERKALMADLANGFITLPGGIGTLEEITETITWSQLGYHNKPYSFLNINGYFDHFFRFFRHIQDEGFLYHPIQETAIIEENIQSLLTKLRTHK